MKVHWAKVIMLIMRWLCLWESVLTPRPNFDNMPAKCSKPLPQTNLPKRWRNVLNTKSEKEPKSFMWFWKIILTRVTIFPLLLILVIRP